MRESGAEVIGRGGLVIKVTGLAGALLFFVFSIRTATVHNNSLGLAARDALLFGLLAGALVLAATTSVRLDGACLVLVRLASVTAIPLLNIEQVSGDDGLEIKTSAGVTYTHIGYGSSLLGSLTGNRRSTRLAAEINEHVEAVRKPGVTVLSSVQAHPRPGLGWLVLLPAVFALMATLVHR